MKKRVKMKKVLPFNFQCLHDSTEMGIWCDRCDALSLMSNHAIKDERQEPKHHFYLRDLGRFFASTFNFLLKHISKSDRGTNPSICAASFESK